MKKCFLQSYAPNYPWDYAWDFNGSTNWLEKTSNLSGISNSPKGICCFFVDGMGSSQYILSDFDSGGGGQQISIKTTGVGALELTIADGVDTYQVYSTSSFPAGWNAVHMSWDADFTAGNKLIHIYINDTGGSYTVTTDGNAVNVPYANSDYWAIGAQQSSGGGLLNACLAQFYFQPGEYIDFSNSVNRRKYSTSGFEPAFIGHNGELLTGTQPKIFLKSSVGNIGLNSGTGGNFDTLHGTFSACGSTP